MTFSYHIDRETKSFGKGELSGLQANLRALCVSIGPFLYAAAYARGIKMGRPGAALLLAAVVAASAELMHQHLIALESKATKKAESHG